MYNKIKFPLKVLISLGILAILVFRMDTDLLLEASHSIHPWAWALAIFFILLQVAILSLRWMHLINIGHHRMTYADCFQVTIASYIANILFIATIGGIVVRIAMALQYGSSLFKAVFATGMDRMMTLAALVLFSTIFLPSLSKYVDAPLMKDISISIGIMMLVIFVLIPLVTLFVINKLPNAIISKGNIRSGVRYLKLLFSNNILLGKILSVSLLAQMFFFLAAFVIAKSIDIDISLLQMMIVLPVISLVSSLPFSIGGWGVREGAFVYGLGLLGVEMEKAFATSIQIGLVSLLATVVVSIPALISGNIKLNMRKKNA